jgi:prepilin-type N-terminal cleavage/methylation domain-containing protein
MRKKRGFSLIEVLLAIFLVVVCAFIVAATMPIANTSRAKASDLDKAMGLAQKQLEAIRGVGYANVTPAQLASYGLVDSTTPTTTNTYSFTNSDSANLDNPARILTNGSGTVMVEQLDVDLRRVTVNVTWRDRVKYKTFSVGTLIANL